MAEVILRPNRVSDQVSLHSSLPLFPRRLGGFTHYPHPFQRGIYDFGVSPSILTASRAITSFVVSSSLSVSSFIFQEVFSVDIHMLKMPFSQQRILH